MRNINEKLIKIYNFTVDYIESNGFPPSVREICAQCQIKSTATAYLYIEKLREKGLFEKSPSKKRALKINTPKNNVKNIPLIGTITAGSPIYAVENLEGYLPVPNEFISNDESFALRVNGQSMINAGILNNDIIIVKKSNSANNGEIVVALIDDSATVKRLFIKENQYILHPENPEMEDIILDNVKILGIVKGLIRKL